MHSIETVRSLLLGSQHSIEQALEMLDRLPGESTPSQSDLDFCQLLPGKVVRTVLVDLIGVELRAFAKDRPSYKVSEFRRHCEPLLAGHLRQGDVMTDSDGRPMWHGRFDYAHKQVAVDILGFTTAGDGTYCTRKELV
jgi:hypothetical protein